MAELPADGPGGMSPPPAEPPAGLPRDRPAGPIHPGSMGLPARIPFHVLALKELRETLRDRRTILTLVLMPLLLYPLLSLVFQRFLVASLRPMQRVVYRVAVASQEEDRILAELLDKASDAPRDAPPVPNALSSLSLEPGDDADIERVVRPDFDDAIGRLQVDAGVRIRSRLLPDGRPAHDVEVIAVRASQASREAAALVERRLLAAGNEILQDRLRAAGASGQSLTVSRQTVTPADGGAALSLAALIPLILILMTITGAVYPAIDLTAGERERGTLEALIAAPIPRMGLLTAKYVAVVTVALLTATVNLASMAVTLSVSGLGPILLGERGLTATLVGQVFCLLTLFAAFFSAVLLAVTSFARSFKEAQAYLIPLMLLAMAPGIVSLLPGVRLTATLSVAPLINVVLLARDLFEAQRVPGALAAVVVVSTALWAGAALAVAARVFGADAILYGSQGTWSDLWERPARPASAPTAASGLVCLAFLFPAHFLLSHLLAGLAGEDPAARLAVSGVLTAALFGGAPVAAALLRRVRVRDGLRLRGAKPGAFLGAALLGATLWTTAYECAVVADQLGLTPLEGPLKDAVESMLEGWKRVPVWLVVLSMALLPALCEELFFRGYLLSALRTRLGDWQAIVATGLLFGAFHLVTGGFFTPIRLVPSALLGIALGWVCVRSGSLWPGVALHATHNALLVLTARYRDELAQAGVGVDEATHLPLWLLGSAIAIAAAGFALVQVSRGSGDSSRSSKNE